MQWTSQFTGKRYAQIRAFFVIFVLIVLSAVFSYPNLLWYGAIIGGALSAVGFFDKRKILVNLGVGIMGSAFYLSNLDFPFTLLNVTILVGALVLFYAALLYINNLMRINSILRCSEGKENEILEDYRKEWNHSLLKNSSLTFVISLLAMLISWAGSFNFSEETDIMVLFGFSLLFVAITIFLIYFLIIKLPDFHQG